PNKDRRRRQTAIAVRSEREEDPCCWSSPHVKVLTDNSKARSQRCDGDRPAQSRDKECPRRPWLDLGLDIAGPANRRGAGSAPDCGGHIARAFGSSQASALRKRLAKSATDSGQGLVAAEGSTCACSA